MNKNYQNLKKIIFFSLLWAIIFIINFPNKASANTVVINPSQSQIGTNENFSLTVNIDNVINLKTANFKIDFDQSLLSLKSVEAGNVMRLDLCNPDISTTSEGYINLSRNGCDSIDIISTSSSHTLATIYFESLTATGTSPLYLSNGYLYDASSTEIIGYVWDNTKSILITDNPDHTPPVINNGVPFNILPLNSTSTEISVDSNEIAICHISTNGVLSFEDMEGVMNTMNSLNHSYTITGLQNGHQYNYVIKCRDNSGNISSDYAINFSVDDITICKILPANTTIEAGGNYQATLRLENVNNIVSIESHIIYDSTKLNYNNYALADDINNSDWSVTILPDGNRIDILIISLDSASISGNLDLINFNFTTLNSGSSTLSFYKDLDNYINNTLYDSDFNEININWQGAEISILENQSPILDISFPDSSIYATTSSSIQVRGTITDNLLLNTLVSTINSSSSTTTLSSLQSYNIDHVFSLNGGSNLIVFIATDVNGNIAIKTLNIIFDLPPIRSNKLLNGELNAGTTNTTLSFKTDKLSYCRMSQVANTPYESMTISLNNQATTSFSYLVNGLTNSSAYHYFFKCQDTLGINNTDDYEIMFSVKSANTNSGNGGGSSGGGGITPPSVANGTSAASTSINLVTSVSSTREDDKIILNWTNPNIADFDKVIIIKTTTQIFDYLTFEALSTLCEKIYEGKSQSYTDTKIEKNISYYYAIFTKTTGNKYSKPFIIQKLAVNEINTNNNTSLTSQDLLKKYSLKNLGGVSSAIVNEISEVEAKEIFNYKKRVALNSITQKLYNFIISKSPHALYEQDKSAIAEFIHDGTPTSYSLGAGERTGVINSYLSAFKKLPRSDEEWQDIIKIANGRWPNEKNNIAELNASDEYFSKVYKRRPNMKNANDNAAVSVIAYGLRPAIRNTNSELQAVRIFKAIYNYLPISAIDWDIVRAIAYSGAIR
jgi:hypothetical protein